MNKYVTFIAVLSLFLVAAAPVHGALVGGCVDSPENPTAILGLAAGVGVAAVSFRSKIATLLRGIGKLKQR